MLWNKAPNVCHFHTIEWGGLPGRCGGLVWDSAEGLGRGSVPWTEVMPPPCRCRWEQRSHAGLSLGNPINLEQLETSFSRFNLLHD